MSVDKTSSQDRDLLKEILDAMLKRAQEEPLFTADLIKTLRGLADAGALSSVTKIKKALTDAN